MFQSTDNPCGGILSNECINDDDKYVAHNQIFQPICLFRGNQTINWCVSKRAKNVAIILDIISLSSLVGWFEKSGCNILKINWKYSVICTLLYTSNNLQFYNTVHKCDPRCGWCSPLENFWLWTLLWSMFLTDLAIKWGNMIVIGATEC